MTHRAVDEIKAPSGQIGEYWRRGYLPARPAAETGGNDYSLVTTAVNAAIHYGIGRGFTPFEELLDRVWWSAGKLHGIGDVHNLLGVYPATITPPVDPGVISRCLGKERPFELLTIRPDFPGHHSVLIVGQDHHYDNDVYYVCGWTPEERVSEVPDYEIDRQLAFIQESDWLVWHGRVWATLEERR